MPLDLALDTAALALRLLFLAILYYFVYKVARLLSRSLQSPQRQEMPMATLVVVDPGSTPLRPGQEIPVAPVTSMGRSPSNTVVIDDPTVSAEHALLIWDKDGWWLTDRGSLAGTALNGRPVTGPVRVEFGDTIGISGVKLKLVPLVQGTKKGAG